MDTDNPPNTVCATALPCTILITTSFMFTSTVSNRRAFTLIEIASFFLEIWRYS